MAIASLEEAQLIYRHRLEKLFNDDPELARFKELLIKTATPKQPQPTVTNEVFGPQKRESQSAFMSWLKTQLVYSKVANVYDLAGPDAGSLAEKWISLLKSVSLFQYQITRVTLIDRKQECVDAAVASEHWYLKEAILGDIWDVLSEKLRGKGTRGNALISLDFCGTIRGASSGDNPNPDVMEALPRLISKITGQYKSLTFYLTVANRNDGTAAIKGDMQHLSTLLDVGNYKCKSYMEPQSYCDSHPMLTTAYHLVHT
jgi:hypothetical protein